MKIFQIITQASVANFNIELKKAAELGYTALPESYRIITYSEINTNSPTGVGTGVVFSAMLCKETAE